MQSSCQVHHGCKKYKSVTHFLSIKKFLNKESVYLYEQMKPLR